MDELCDCLIKVEPDPVGGSIITAYFLTAEQAQKFRDRNANAKASNAAAQGAAHGAAPGANGAVATPLTLKAAKKKSG